VESGCLVAAVEPLLLPNCFVATRRLLLFRYYSILMLQLQSPLPALMPKLPSLLLSIGTERLVAAVVGAGSKHSVAAVVGTGRECMVVAVVGGCL